MDIQTLRQKNPNIPFYSVFDPEFRAFGRVIDFDAASLIETCEKTAVMPESGSSYVPVMEALEALPAYAQVKNILRGQGSCEIGCCWGYNSKLNALEYHRASEHNIAVSDMVLLLGQQQEMEGFELPAGKVTGFFVPKGTTVEVFATTLHYAPCQTSDAGFRCIVILPRGTNFDLQGECPEGGDARLLTAQDKWLICHDQLTEMIDAGSYPGLHGENFTVVY